MNIGNISTFFDISELEGVFSDAVLLSVKQLLSLMLPLQWVTVIKFVEKYKNSWLRVSSFSFSGFFGLRSSIFVFDVLPESSHFTLPATARLNRKPVSGKTTHSRQILQLCKSNRQNNLNFPPETYLCSRLTCQILC